MDDIKRSKTTKRITALLAALAMVFGLSTTVRACWLSGNYQSIVASGPTLTVNNASCGTSIDYDLENCTVPLVMGDIATFSFTTGVATNVGIALNANGALNIEKVTIEKNMVVRYFKRAITELPP